MSPSSPCGADGCAADVNQVTNCFRAVVIVLSGYQVIKSKHQIVIESDRESLHGFIFSNTRVVSGGRAKPRRG